MSAAAAAPTRVEAGVLSRLAVYAKYGTGKHRAGTAIDIPDVVRGQAVPARASGTAQGRGAAAAGAARGQVATKDKPAEATRRSAGVTAIAAFPGGRGERCAGAAAAAIHEWCRHDSALPASATAATAGQPTGPSAAATAESGVGAIAALRAARRDVAGCGTDDRG
ncbi:hypothetical protein [Bordetella genomosp. 9]|uniref:hypothetical protein n=1 Tax=Bordetella genomosp. 9 TaxID=1416803 RepID=UPI0011789666|nr:hypothetical protein [Bordetella genomosp. 9]